MSDGFKRFLYVFISVFLTALISFLLPFCSYYLPERMNNIQISGGTGNLIGFNESSEKPVYLSGEWEFFRDRLIISENDGDLQPDLIVSVPSSWTEYELNGKRLGNGGCASYRLKVRNLYSSMPVIVTLPNMPGAYRAYIDGQLVSSNCPSAVNMRNAESEVDLFTDPAELGDVPRGIHEIVIEVSCNYSSGITVMPELSTYSVMQNRIIGAVSLRYFLIGIVIFFSLTVAAFSILLKGKMKLYWLVILCLSFAFRLVISNEGYTVSHGMFFGLGSEFTISLVYVSTYIIKLSMFMHIIYSLDLDVSQNVTVIFSALFLICAFVPYFLYEEIYYATSYIWLQSVVYLLDIYLIYKISGAVVAKKRFSLLYLIGYCTNVAAMIIDSYYLNGYITGRVSVIMPLSVVGFIAMLILIHIVNTVKAYSEAKRAAELGEELADLNTRLMISQIQPHFLYNALNSIKYLIKRDPKNAETAIVKFSNYLRANMDSLTQKEPIPVSKELDHVKNYAEIEKIRFGERLNIEYEILCTDFSVPPLTVQPIVENAIKHGVNQKPEGGTVRIFTDDDDENYYIGVEDDGVGFDPNVIPDDGRSHVGVNNIKERLKKILDADVSIASEQGVGTKVLISIPKKKEV